MTYQTVLKNARTLDGVYDIGINENGIILSVAPGLDGRQEIELDGLYVLPGLVDPHVHFRDLGQEHKETWFTGSRAALSGGITYVGDMPNNLEPITTFERLERKRRITQRDSVVNFGLYVAVTPDSLPHLRELAQHAIAFKLFMGESTGEINFPYNRLEKAFEAVAKTGKLLCVHAEDQRVLDEGKKEYGNQIRRINHSLARPPEAEIKAIEYAIELSQGYGVPLHICHVTTRDGVELIRQAKTKGLDVTVETCPHYLLMNIFDINRLGPYTKMNPPLRCYDDQKELWKGIQDGTIDWIASDHAPHTREEKDKGLNNIWLAPGGVPGVETTVQLMLNSVNEGILTLPQLVRLIHDNPVARFDLGRYGYVEKGNPANLTIVDLEEPWEIINEELLTKCGWSPYNGWSGVGRPVGIVINGRYHGI